MQDNCQFGDMLKDEKRKSQFKYELGRLMGEYIVGQLQLEQQRNQGAGALE